ncbi:MAG: hypothetical protein GY759_22070 [Chloroflexi bacterium]|nr:hypothetical protein [Chloroflexota bacterium]
MSTVSHRILYLGRGGILSLLPLRALLDAGAHVVGVVVPGPNAESAMQTLTADLPLESDLPLALSPVMPDIRHEAWRRDIPVFQVGNIRATEAISVMRVLQADVICVSCFPRILPKEWLDSPAVGALNLHPSLLPAYRGPNPLFWQFRAGEELFGMTLHFMNEGIDSGDIVDQGVVSMPDGVTTVEATGRLAQLGARLLVDALAKPTLPRRSQPETAVSYQSFPGPEQSIIPTTWSAKRAYNFIRGADSWGPFFIKTSSGTVHVHRAVAFDDNESQKAATIVDGTSFQVRFAKGTLTVVGKMLQ